MHVQENDYEELAGDPDHLQTMAQHYMGIADKIRKSVPFLKSLSEGDAQKSKSTDALKDSAKKVGDDIEKAESRYRVTAQALLDYVPFQRQAKDDAHTAVLKIKEAEGDVTSTGKSLNDANDAADKADDKDKDDAKTAQDKAKTASDDAKKDLEHWKQKWRDARDYRNTHAHQARNKINDLIQNHNNGLKNPEHHWWDSVGHFFSSVWHAIEGPLKFICKWAGVLSIFLGWVPILGEVLIGLAILGAAITLVEDIASGKGWKTILGDSIGLALAVFGGGVGKFLGKLAKFKRFTAMERFAASSNSGNKFKAAFGVARKQFRRGLARDQLGSRGVVKLTNAEIDAMKASKLKVFLNDVKNPFSGYDRSLGVSGNWAKAGDNWADFKSNPLGLISKEVGFTKSGLSIPARIGFGAYDVRGVIQSGTSLVNTGNDLIHHDFGLNGDKNSQLKDYSPDGYGLGKLSG